MGSSRKAVWVVAALLFVAVLWAFPMVMGGFGDDVDGPAEASEGKAETFDFTGSATLSFVDLNGSISVVKAEKEEERQQISIIATRKARGADQAQAKVELEKVAVAIEKTRDGLEIRSKTSAGWFRQPSAAKRVDFRIVAPEGTGIRVTSGRGSVNLKGVQGNISLEGPSLAVDLNDVRGNIMVKTDKGNIRILNSLGETRVETREGSIALNRIAGGVLIARGSGDITVKDGGAEGDLRVVSKDGNITVDRSRGKTVAIETASGQIKVVDTTAAESLSAVAKSGAMTFTRVNADRFQAATDSGDLDLTDVQGHFDLKTGQGGVTVWRATAQGLKIRGTTDAAFYGELPKDGETSIQIAAGTIAVYVNKESAFKLDAKTGSGKIVVDKSLELETQDGPASTHLKGTANGGGVLLSLSTGAGDIKISAGGPPAYFSPGGSR